MEATTATLMSSPIPPSHDTPSTSFSPSAPSLSSLSTPFLSGTESIPASTSIATRSTGESLPNLGDLDAKCGGCAKMIDQESGGVVVAFGTALWHVDCFRCAKCQERVSADTNLLLLSDGQPVCGNCSYQCFVCKQAITEEAIMTGDESYHAHCFTCRTCKRRIEELVFAKTSQGIYCMACHNERVARSRRHAEQRRARAARKEKEKQEQEEGGKLENRSESTSGLAPTSTPSLGPTLPSDPSPSGSPAVTPNPVGSAQFLNQTPDPSMNGSGSSSKGLSSFDVRQRDLSVDLALNSLSLNNLSRSPNRRGDMSLPASPSADSIPSAHQRSATASPALGQSEVVTTAALTTKTGAVGLGVGPVHGLGVPTSKADRRRSINPAMTFNMDAANSTFAAEPRMSPLPPSPLRTSFSDLQAEQASANNGNVNIVNNGLSSPPSPSIDQPGVPPPPPRTSSLSDQQMIEGKLRDLTTDDWTSTATPATVTPVAFPSPKPAPAPSPEPPTSTTMITTPPPPASPATVIPMPMPQIDAPNLPAMSFSLSDPDFANILNGIESDATTGSHSTPPSSSPAPLSRSPQMSLLSTAGGTREDTSISPSFRASSPTNRDRLSPNDQSSPPTLSRMRQISAESTMSIASKIEPESALQTLIELIASAKQKEEMTISLGISVASGIIREHEELRETALKFKSKYNGARRSSQQYSEGLTVAGEEYDKEVALRRELEAEVIRLRAQVHSQTARLSVISGDERRQENLRRRSQDLVNSLTGLERDISRLRAQRDITLAEVEVVELHKRMSIDSIGASGESPSTAGGSGVGGGFNPSTSAPDLGQALTTRLDTIREQYREELEPLTAQREALLREIAELREAREQVLEESTALAAKNEELAELNTQLTRQTEVMQDALRRGPSPVFAKLKTHPSNSPSLSSLATTATLHEVPEETARVVKVTKPEPIEQAPARRFKWYKSSKGPSEVSAMGMNGLGGGTTSSSSGSGSMSGGGSGAGSVSSGPGSMGNGSMMMMSGGISKPLPPNGNDKRNNLHRPSTDVNPGIMSMIPGVREHNFQQHSTMRFTRCELCQEKMWGLQEVRCSSCGTVCHAKCADKLPKICSGNKAAAAILEPDVTLPPSMFGRELSEQVIADKKPVPVIVTKCIEAVEVVGMEYEGIYRKTGGSSQSKQITQLFERGDYDSFDLSNLDIFNDISSVTSVLKTYFRQLPNPLLTHALHESFVAAASIQNANNKHAALCALLAELPKDHYNTLRALMLHLNRVTAQAAVNLMTSQNLGVVFGPTLMRSKDPKREFGDMAGKALSVQWMVENAPNVFGDPRE